jgi:hypothetical protein
MKLVFSEFCRTPRLASNEQFLGLRDGYSFQCHLCAGDCRIRAHVCARPDASGGPSAIDGRSRKGIARVRGSRIGGKNERFAQGGWINERIVAVGAAGLLEDLW